MVSGLNYLLRRPFGPAINNSHHYTYTHKAPPRIHTRFIIAIIFKLASLLDSEWVLSDEEWSGILAFETLKVVWHKFFAYWIRDPFQCIRKVSNIHRDIMDENCQFQLILKAFSCWVNQFLLPSPPPSPRIATSQEINTHSSYRICRLSFCLLHV